MQLEEQVETTVPDNRHVPDDDTVRQLHQFLASEDPLHMADLAEVLAACTLNDEVAVAAHSANRIPIARCCVDPRPEPERDKDILSLAAMKTRRW